MTIIGQPRGNGLLHRRAAGFADDEMMRHHQFRHLVRPAEDFHAVFKLARAFDEFRTQFGITSRRDGQMHVVNFEQTVNRLARFFLAGVDDVKHAARFVGDWCGQIIWIFREQRADGKSENLDLLFGDAAFFQNLRRLVVGDTEKIAWRAEPRGVDGDGIRDDGDEAEWPLVVVGVNLFDDVAINRISGDDAIRLRLGEDFFQSVLQARETAELFLDEWMFQHRINSAPEFRRVLHDAEVAFSGEGVERAVAVGEQIHDFGARVLVEHFNRVAQTACGGVVPVTESSGQYKDFFHGQRNTNLSTLRPCDEQVKFYSHFLHNFFTAKKQPI